MFLELSHHSFQVYRHHLKHLFLKYLVQQQLIVLKISVQRTETVHFQEETLVRPFSLPHHSGFAQLKGKHKLKSNSAT